MKRIGGRIYERLSSEENLTAAFYEAARGKRNKTTYGSQIADFENRLKENIARLHKELCKRTWKPHGTRTTERIEHGKRRKITWFKCFEDLVVMHALHRTVGVLLERKLIEDTYSGIKGRGIRKGMRRIKRWLAEYPDDMPIKILKWDFRHYYPSIKVSRMKAKLARYIKDKYVLWLYGVFLDACPNELPIGSYLSQLLANLFLTDIDRAAKRMGFRHYARYCDDGMNAHSDTERLKEFKAMLYKMAEEDGLEIKANIQMFPIERHGLDFMGYTFHRHGLVRLRKRTERRFRRAVHVCKRENGRGNLVERVASYKGLVYSLTWGGKLWMSVVGMEFKDFYKKYRGKNANT